jgi:hypothetical protein
MALLDSPEVPTEGHRVVRVRVDRISATGDKELWWVALGFEDGSTKPQGMFTDFISANILGSKLAADWGVEVAISKLS